MVKAVEFAIFVQISCKFLLTFVQRVIVSLTFKDRAEDKTVGGGRPATRCEHDAISGTDTALCEHIA